MLNRLQRGVTSIELMIGIAILAILMAAGMPSMSAWISNAQIRGGAEIVQSGMQLARGEAIKRNAPVRFTLTEADGQIGWRVGCVSITTAPDCPATIQARTAVEASSKARIGASTAIIPNPAPSTQFTTALAAGAALPAGVTFDGFGRTVPAAGADIARVDVINPASAGARRMVITVGSGGVVRMCDPALSRATNSQGC
jgi:type IV fimbrial biogenesis protein FimT